MKAKLTRAITRLFGLEEGELQKAFMLQLILFLLITTLLLLKPTINSIFLSALGADALPLGYIFTAIAAAIGAKYYDKSLESFRLHKIIISTLFGILACLLFFAFAFYFQWKSTVILYSLYIFVAIYGLLVTSQFWLMANTVYNIRQAKRAFGFIGAGGIAGGIFGGYFTSVLSSVMPSENILFVAAFLVLCCVPLYRIFWKKEQMVSGVISRERKDEAETTGKTPMEIIRGSKLLLYITLVTGLSVLIAKLIDYQYSDFATRLMGDKEKLSSFFGIWLSNISILSLVIQLFLTERILKLFGVGSSTLIMPGAILLGSILLLIMPELWVVVFIKVADGSFKQSVDKSAKELIYMPVPFDAKKKTKTFIDVVVDSLATGIAGLLLFFFIQAFDVSSVYVSIIIIAMLGLEVGMILRLKKAYRESFRKLAKPPPVSRHTVVKRRSKAPLDSVPDTVAWIFENGEDAQILYMLHRTFEYPDERFSGPLRGLLNHDSKEIRSMAIKSLYHLHGENISEHIEKLVCDCDATTSTQAMRYLINREIKGKRELFEKYFYRSDINVSNAALVGMAKELRNNRKLQHKYQFDDYIKFAVQRWQEEERQEVRKSMLMAILLSIGHAQIVKYYKLLEEELTNPDHEILRIALKAAARTKDFRFLDLIVSHLSNKALREQAQFSLFKYGQIVISKLKKKIFEGIKNFQDSIFVPEVIEKFKNQKAVDALIEISEKGDHIVALASIQSLIRLNEYPHLKISDRYIVRNVKRECKKFRDIISIIHALRILNEQIDVSLPGFKEEKEAREGLLNLLRQWVDRPNRRFIYLLNLKYPIADLYPMAQVLLEGKLEQKISAGEFLENIFSFEIRRALMPIIESLMVKTDDRFEEMFESLKGSEMEEYQCLSKLMSYNNIKIRHACLYLISKIKNPMYIPLVEKHFEDFHLKIQQHAKDTHAVLKLQQVRV